MRLFVALNLPPAERERLHGAARRLREGGLPVRCVVPEQLHLTLKFLGEVADERAPEIERVVESAARGARPFELELGGVGGFPTLRRARVVWLGVEAPPELPALVESLEEGFERLGFEREARDFHPHLTLGRAQRGARAPELGRLESLAPAVEYRARVRAETLDLMCSRLRRSGAEYEVVRAAPFGGGRDEG